MLIGIMRDEAANADRDPDALELSLGHLVTKIDGDRAGKLAALGADIAIHGMREDGPAEYGEGTTLTAVAREVGIHPGQLYGWRRQLLTQQPVGFAPVRIVPDAASAGVAGPGTIEIEFATGARMRITGAVDAAVLTAAVAVLAEGRRR